MYGKKRNEMSFPKDSRGVEFFDAAGEYSLEEINTVKNARNEMSEDDLTHYMKKCAELSAERDALAKKLEVAMNALRKLETQISITNTGKFYAETITFNPIAHDALTEIERIK
jgi:hypothetical protein